MLSYKVVKMNNKAFSLIELMVSLLIVSIIMAALAPVLNKRLKNGTVALNNKLTERCSVYGFDDKCTLCWGANKCVICLRDCLETQTLNVEQCKCMNN